MNITTSQLRSMVPPETFARVTGESSPKPRRKRGEAKAERVAELDAIRKADAGKAPLAFVLPYPPSANRYWRCYRNQMVPSADAIQFKNEVRRIVGDVQPFIGDVAILIDIYRPQASGDLDNRIKVCLDALSELAFVDDKQVSSIFARRFDDKDRPRAEVQVLSASPAEGGSHA